KMSAPKITYIIHADCLSIFRYAFNLYNITSYLFYLTIKFGFTDCSIFTDLRQEYSPTRYRHTPNSNNNKRYINFNVLFTARSMENSLIFIGTHCIVDNPSGISTI